MQGGCDAWVTCLARGFDNCIRAVEPALAVAAAVLVLMDAGVFFKVVLPQVLETRGTAAAASHALVGLWLLTNVLWNQAFCVFTKPGYTTDCDALDVEQHMTFEWRWCIKCKRGKPPCSHHCSICNRCVLKMDHHCPWMANCIGFKNLKFFTLYLFYMWIGSAYSVTMSVYHVPHLFDIHRLGHRDTWHHFTAFIFAVLAFAVFMAMTILFGVHVWMIISGSGTIDMIGVYMSDMDAPSRRTAILSNPYHLGKALNWQEAFDVRGKRLWWLIWMLPTSQHKLGNGWQLPRRPMTA